MHLHYKECTIKRIRDHRNETGYTFLINDETAVHFRLHCIIPLNTFVRITNFYPKHGKSDESIEHSIPTPSF